MIYFPVAVPGVVSRLFPELIWTIKTTQKHIYLTFDDGPTPEITNWVLDTLKLYNAKATFFCIGENVKNHPALYNKILDANHAVGNHTQNHLKGWKTTTNNYLHNIEKATKFIDSKLFRPPYGQLKLNQIKQIKQLDYRIVMWSILSLDWDNNVSSKTCLNNVLNHTRSGSVVVFHDSVKASKHLIYVLPKVLEYYTKKGYSFKRIPE